MKALRAALEHPHIRRAIYIATASTFLDGGQAQELHRELELWSEVRDAALALPAHPGKLREALEELVRGFYQGWPDIPTEAVAWNKARAALATAEPEGVLDLGEAGGGRMREALGNALHVLTQAQPSNPQHDAMWAAARHGVIAALAGEEWAKVADRLPVAADEDINGEVWWWHPRLGPSLDGWNLRGHNTEFTHWRRTGLTRPAPPLSPAPPVGEGDGRG